MAIDLHTRNIPQWIKDGRVFHGFGGVLTTPETQPATDIVYQQPTFFIRVPAGVVIVPIQSQVAFEATTAILQVLVCSARNDIGVATSVRLDPVNVNSRYATRSSTVSAYATNTGATGTDPTGRADLYREYHQADRDAITTTGPVAPITYSPLTGIGTPAVIGMENNINTYLFYAVAGTAGASTCFHIHSWAEFTYDEFYAGIRGGSMAQDSYAGPLSEVRSVSTADGGTAITNSLGTTPLPDNINWLSLTPRNFSTAVVLKFSLVPYLILLKTADNLATWTRYSEEAQDADATTDITLSSLGTFAGGDFLLVGSHLPFRGVRIDVDSSNSTSNTITVKYWNGTAWADISATDGTDSGASLGQDGDVTWTVPAAWTKARLKDTTTPTPTGDLNAREMSESFYWTRWEWDVALDASVTLNSMVGINRSTAWAELVSGQPFETAIHKGIGGVGAVEALTDAGTANLIINVGQRPEPGMLGIGL